MLWAPIDRSICARYEPVECISHGRAQTSSSEKLNLSFMLFVVVVVVFVELAPPKSKPMETITRQRKQ